MAGCFFIKKGACSRYLLVAILVQTVAISFGGSCTKIWEDPCDKNLHQVRHGRSTETDRAMDSMGVFINNVSIKNLKKIYSKEAHKTIPINSNCPPFRKLIRSVSQAKNLTDFELQTYKSLTKFALYLDKLDNVTVKTVLDFDKKGRDEIFKNTCNNIRRLICEHKLSLTEVHKLERKVLEKLPRINTTCVPTSANVSELQILDIQFFKKLKRFFRQTNRKRTKFHNPNGKLKKNKNKKKNKGSNKRKWRFIKTTTTTENNIEKIFDHQSSR